MSIHGTCSSWIREAAWVLLELHNNESVMDACCWSGSLHNDESMMDAGCWSWMDGWGCSNCSYRRRDPEMNHLECESSGSSYCSVVHSAHIIIQCENNPKDFSFFSRGRGNPQTIWQETWCCTMLLVQYSESQIRKSLRSRATAFSFWLATSLHG